MSKKAGDDRLCQVHGYGGTGQVQTVTLSRAHSTLFQQPVRVTGGGVGEQDDQLW